jgi:phosphopantothenoylcysteine decarboxylase
MRILVGVTGSVAAILTPKLVQQLQHEGHEVKVVLTGAAMHFVQPEQFDVTVHTDHDEWLEAGHLPSGEVLHISLRRWADMLVIAPLSANTLSKLAHAGADNLLTSVVRAWDRSKRLVLAPAMNTLMWKHPATSEQIAQLKAWYALSVILPQVKELACGDVGIGALAPIPEILSSIAEGVL